jgi:hypothetical protein
MSHTADINSSKEVIKDIADKVAKARSDFVHLDSLTIDTYVHMDRLLEDAGANKGSRLQALATTCCHLWSTCGTRGAEAGKMREKLSMTKTKAPNFIAEHNNFFERLLAR